MYKHHPPPLCSWDCMKVFAMRKIPDVTIMWGRIRGSLRDVVYLGWPIAPFNLWAELTESTLFSFSRNYSTVCLPVVGRKGRLWPVFRNKGKNWVEGKWKRLNWKEEKLDMEALVCLMDQGIWWHALMETRTTGDNILYTLLPMEQAKGRLPGFLAVVWFGSILVLDDYFAI